LSAALLERTWMTDPSPGRNGRLLIRFCHSHRLAAENPDDA